MNMMNKFIICKTKSINWKTITRELLKNPKIRKKPIIKAKIYGNKKENRSTKP